jgi:hypothetical protein
MDFTDVALFSPLLVYLISGMGEKGKGGEDTLRGTNQVVTAFFYATLCGDEAGWSRVSAARPRFSSVCDRLPVP